jgi:hypothetical protein
LGELEKSCNREDAEVAEDGQHPKTISDQTPAKLASDPHQLRTGFLFGLLSVLYVLCVLRVESFV